MAKPLGDADTVHTIEIEHGGHCVPECVGVDVGQPVADAEFIEPIGYAVGVHRAAVLLCEKKTSVLIVSAQLEPPFYLPDTVFP